MAEGMINDAFGRWIKSTRPETAKYVEQLEAKSKLNKERKERKRLRRQLKWLKAEELARRDLVRSGDSSSPLPWFVSTFLKKIRKGDLE
jgi:hypothetical protein